MEEELPKEFNGRCGQIVYGYLLDFSEVVPPEVTERIVIRHGSLQVRVGPNFLENLRSDYWPH